MKIENGIVGVAEILFSIDKAFHHTVCIDIKSLKEYLIDIYLDLINRFRKEKINSDEDLHDAFIEILLKEGWTIGPGFNLKNKSYKYIISYNDLDFLMETRVNSFYYILKLFYGGKD